MSYNTANHPEQASTLRELWITPDVQEFIESSGDSAEAKYLLADIFRFLGGDKAEYATMHICKANDFLLSVIEPADAGGPERLIVFHACNDRGYLGLRSPYYAMTKASFYGLSLT